MRIFKRDKVYYIDYIDGQGNRRRESTGTGNKSLAEKVAAKKEMEIFDYKKMGIKPIDRVLLSKFNEDYFEYSKANKKPKSTEIDIMAINNFTAFIADKMKMLDEITEEDIEKYKIARGKQVSKSTVSRELASIKHFFNIAEQWGKIQKNPAKRIKKPGEPPGRVRYLTTEEIKVFIQECHIPYLRLFVIIALNTGMRKSEILNIKWEDIDFDNDLIHLEDTKSGERADILMNSSVKAALNAYEREGDSLFTIKDLKKSFKNALKRAGISNFRIHDLRHTFASHLVMNGVTLTTVRELMRHKDFKITLRYAHLSPAHKKEAIEKLAQIWHIGKSKSV